MSDYDFSIFSRFIACPYCNGSNPGCFNCGGTGRVLNKPQQYAPVQCMCCGGTGISGFVFGDPVICVPCGGTGYVTIPLGQNLENKDTDVLARIMAKELPRIRAAAEREKREKYYPDLIRFATLRGYRGLGLQENEAIKWAEKYADVVVEANIEISELDEFLDTYRDYLFVPYRRFAKDYLKMGDNDAITWAIDNSHIDINQYILIDVFKVILGWALSKPKLDDCEARKWAIKQTLRLAPRASEDIHICDSFEEDEEYGENWSVKKIITEGLFKVSILGRFDSRYDIAYKNVINDSKWVWLKTSINEVRKAAMEAAMEAVEKEVLIILADINNTSS